MFKSLFDSGKKTNFFLPKKMHSLQSTKNQSKSAITRPFFDQPWNRLIFYAIPQLFSRVVHDLVAWNEVWSRVVGFGFLVFWKILSFSRELSSLFENSGKKKPIFFNWKNALTSKHQKPTEIGNNSTFFLSTLKPFDFLRDSPAF